MNKYWFKPKTHGWGFVPVTWEGWLATLVLIVFVLLAALGNGLYSEELPTVKESVHFLLDIGLITGLMVLLFERKMKEPLKWRWGNK